MRPSPRNSLRFFLAVFTVFASIDLRQRRSVIELEILTHDRHRRIGDRHVGVVQILLPDGARNGLYRRGKSKYRGRADIDPVDVSDCRVSLEFESTVGSAQNDAATRDRSLRADTGKPLGYATIIVMHGCWALPRHCSVDGQRRLV